MTRSKNWGGARHGAGRHKKRIVLDPETAKSLYLLTKHRRAISRKPELSEEQVVGELVEQAWQDTRQEYEKGAEIAQDLII